MISPMSPVQFNSREVFKWYDSSEEDLIYMLMAKDPRREVSLVKSKSGAAFHTPPSNSALRDTMSTTLTSSKKAGKDGKYYKKIKWNKTEHYAFLKHVAYVIRKRHRRSKNLNVADWKTVIDLFKSEERMVVDEQMLRDHYDKARLFFQGWNELKKYTDGAYNEQKCTYECPDSFWPRFLMCHSECGRLREWGYDAEADQNLYTIFHGTCATGDWRWHVGGQPPAVEPPRVLVDEVEDESDGMMSVPLEELVRDVNTPLPQDYSPNVDFKIGSLSRTQDTPRMQDTQTTRRDTGIRPQPQKSKRKRSVSVDPLVHSTVDIIAQTLSERNEIYREHLRVQQEASSKQLHDPVQLQLDECVEFLLSLPNYNCREPMYFEAPSYFMDKKVRTLWLSLRRDPVLAEGWLKKYWENQHK